LIQIRHRQPVSRKEDPVLLARRGALTAMTSTAPASCTRVMVRAVWRMACCAASMWKRHGPCRGIHAVVVAADLDAAGIKNMQAAVAKNRDGSDSARPPQRPLATAACATG